MPTKGYDNWKTLDPRDRPNKRRVDDRKCYDCGEWTDTDLLKEIDGDEYCDLCIDSFNKCDGCGEHFSNFASEEPFVTRFGKRMVERMCDGCYDWDTE